MTSDTKAQQNLGYARMQSIAIYDLDRTVLTRPTFTPFLLYAAARQHLWRLVGLPIWIVAMIGYKLKLYDRKPMKQFGIALFIGREITAVQATRLADGFSARLVPADVQPGAGAAMARDKAAGARMIIATAAPDIYAETIGRQLGFDAVIATCHQRLADGGYRSRMIGENCYGAHKLARVEQWFAAQGIDRAACHVRFYTDHDSDGPLLDWADDGVIVNGGKRLAALAVRRGWHSQNWRQGSGAAR